MAVLAISCISVTSCNGKNGKSASAASPAASKEAVVSDMGAIVPGAQFKDFTVVQDSSDPAGSTVKLSDYAGKGKYILVDFWASWCGPCRREIPNIAAVYEKYKGDRFDVVSVACWDEPEDSKTAIKELGMTWNQIINAQKIATDIYGIEGIPHIILIGPDGKIVADNLRGANIEAAVSKALGN